MEINKQLFEDVLSGKLKGTFALKCGIKASSDELSFNDDYDKEKYPYTLRKMSYTPEGYFHVGERTGGLSIIDFIPDVDMKQNKIVLKDKQLTYEDICKKLFQPNGCYYICGNGEIVINSSCTDRFLSDANNATTKYQLKCILAKNKLATVAKYLNDGWKPGEYDYATYLTLDDMCNISYNRGHRDSFCGQVIFKTNEHAQRAIEILGEEAVKLALEPLGI